MNRYRAVWISDVHLGIKDCKAEFLLDFLQATDCDTLYLVGDLIDFEKMRSGWYWPATHNRVLQCILAKSAQTTRVFYIPGNHDEAARDYVDLFVGQVEIKREAIHETLDRRRLLVVHGDEFDAVVRYGRLLNGLGEHAYDFLLLVNRWVNAARRRLNLPYWSLAGFIKQRIGNAATYVERFEAAAAHEAARRGLDGVVCGHIHKPALTDIEGVLYGNDGDWVENCTALVEHVNGALGIVHWADETVVLAQENPPQIAAMHQPELVR